MTSRSQGTFLERHFTLPHRAVTRVSRMMDNITYTARRGLVKGLKRKGGLGFVPEWVIPDTESAEIRFLRALNLTGQVVFDIGGFHGLLTMFFATRADTVVVFEPHPRNRARLQENLTLNRLTNVIVRPCGVGEVETMLELVADARMLGGASGDRRLAEQMSESARAQRTWVRIVRLDDEITSQGLALPDFVKIDIEGMELDALRGMPQLLSSRRPSLYIEMHGATQDIKQENALGVVRELTARGYTRITHVESNTRLTAASAMIASQGHIFATA